MCIASRDVPPPTQPTPPARPPPEPPCPTFLLHPISAHHPTTCCAHHSPTAPSMPPACLASPASSSPSSTSLLSLPRLLKASPYRSQVSPRLHLCCSSSVTAPSSPLCTRPSSPNSHNSPCLSTPSPLHTRPAAPPFPPPSLSSTSAASPASAPVSFDSPRRPILPFSPLGFATSASCVPPARSRSRSSCAPSPVRPTRPACAICPTRPARAMCASTAQPARTISAGSLPASCATSGPSHACDCSARDKKPGSFKMASLGDGGGEGSCNGRAFNMRRAPGAMRRAPGIGTAAT
ncbi:unnamed protein product [Closterium sp. NIES-54]